MIDIKKKVRTGKKKKPKSAALRRTNQSFIMYWAQKTQRLIYKGQVSNKSNIPRGIATAASKTKIADKNCYRSDQISDSIIT